MGETATLAVAIPTGEQSADCALLRIPQRVMACAWYDPHNARNMLVDPAAGHSPLAVSRQYAFDLSPFVFRLEDGSAAPLPAKGTRLA
jgi:hypothetical protein